MFDSTVLTLALFGPSWFSVPFSGQWLQLLITDTVLGCVSLQQGASG